LIFYAIDDPNEDQRPLIELVAVNIAARRSANRLGPTAARPAGDRV